MTVTLTITAQDGATTTVVLPAPTVSTGGTNPYASVDGSANAPGDTGNSLYTFYAKTSNPIAKYHKSGLADSRVFGTVAGNYAPGNANYYQPPWMVAGVDYPVGIRPQFLPLKVPSSSNLPAGVTLSGKQININSSNVTFQGYDFSGMNIWVPSASTTGVVISDCYTKMSSADTTDCIDGNNAGVTVQYCAIDGGDISTSTASTLNRIWKCQYCYVTNSEQDTFNYGESQPGLSASQQGLFVSFCAIIDGGVGGGHADWYQAGGPPSNGLPWNAVANFNLFWDRGAASMGPSTEGTQGWMLTGQSNPPFIGGFNNNMVITAKDSNGGTPVSKVFGLDNNGSGGHVVAPGVTCQWNYIDPTGSSPVFGYTGSTTDPNVKISNNMNVTTGLSDAAAGFLVVT